MRRTTGGADSYKLLKKKFYDFFSTIRACRVLLLTSSVKVCDLMCRLLGKKFSFVGIIISVHVLNKSRGFEMHWVGGGVKVHRGQYPQFNVQIYLCECRHLNIVIL